MNILIIGNGFDLAHKLPTRYIDFLRYMLSNNFSNIEEDEYKDKLRQARYNNIWIEYFKAVMKEDGSWIDFESEISKVIQALDYMIDFRNRPVNQRKNEDDKKRIIEDKFCQWITGKLSSSVFNGDIEQYNEIMIQPLLKDLNELIECLAIYCDKVIGLKKVEILSQQVIDLNIDAVLSFNYTDTYIKRYEYIKKIKNGEGYKPTVVDYIHGEAACVSKHEPCRMVLGIDEYLKCEEESVKMEFVEFKKYFQRVIKETNQEYRRWISEIVSRARWAEEAEKRVIGEIPLETNNIYVFGHSLDVTDKDILRELFLLPNTNITIYYHEPKRRKELMINMIKVIGAAEFRDRVYPDGNIKFEEQQELIPVENIAYDNPLH